MCGFGTAHPAAEQFGSARGNTARFARTEFNTWKCPGCGAIHCIDRVDFEDAYRDYPLSRRRSDLVARVAMGCLLKRLRRAGLRKTDSILDYGCGGGLFVAFLKSKGYAGAVGYDPHVEEFSREPSRSTRFDWVVSNDVLEHVPDPRAFVRECSRWLKPDGRLYLGGPDAADIDMRHPERGLMLLHLPFHRVILTREGLHRLVRSEGLDIVGSWRRSYLDTPLPFANFRFIIEFNRALGDILDRAFEPGAARIMLRKPRLILLAFLGYFFPVAHEPAVICRPARTSSRTADHGNAAGPMLHPAPVPAREAARN